VVLDVLVAAAAGVGIGLSLAAPPGPVNAIIASRAVARSWRSGFLVGCGALTADAGFLALSVAAQAALAAFAASWFSAIAAAGAAVLAAFAWSAFRSWDLPPATGKSGAGPHAGSYATGLVTNATSPYPLLWWLTAGVALVGQLGPAVLVGFFGGILLWIASFPAALRRAQARFRATYRIVLVLSTACLAAFAGWLAWSAFDALR
jgi:threonine/homoserine/homoserine lactone efflux protein